MKVKLPVGATSRRDRKAAGPQRWSRRKGAPTRDVAVAVLTGLGAIVSIALNPD